jgi:hypothetical protein
MSDDNFIARWSRLKREAESEKRRAAAPGQPSREARDEPPAEEAAQRSAASVEARPAAEPPLDPDALPSIESIVAGSDIRAFLQKGVPTELTKAALRRAWTTDPAIRDFIGIAENQWDFTDPTAIPGFGPLEASGEVRQLIAQAMGRLSDAPKTAGLAEESRPPPSETAEQSPSTAAGAEPASAPPEGKSADDHNTIEVAASQYPAPASVTGAGRRRKGHGAAMPR